MKTYEIRDEQGNVIGFEVNNFLLDRLDVCGLVRRIPGIKSLRLPSGSGEDVFYEFEFDGAVFRASVPAGASRRRYCVGTKPPAQSLPQLGTVRAVFEEARRLWDLPRWRQEW